MERDDIQFDYDDAEFFDETGNNVDEDKVKQTLFEGTRPAAGELVPLANSDKVDFPNSPLTVTEIRVMDNDGKLDIMLRIPELTVGRQLSGGDHPLMVLNRVNIDGYKHFRIGVE